MAAFQHITSIKDERVVEARELTSASGRARLRKVQLDGQESLQWALEARLAVEYVFFSAAFRQHDFLAMLQARGIACYAVSDGILKKISDTSYLVSLIGVARLPVEPVGQEAGGDFVLVLDRIQNHGNLGTIIRTASAFCIRHLVSTTPDLDIYFKKVVSASRGKAFETYLQKCSSASAAIAALKRLLRPGKATTALLPQTHPGQLRRHYRSHTIKGATQHVMLGGSETSEGGCIQSGSRDRNGCQRC